MYRDWKALSQHLEKARDCGGMVKMAMSQRYHGRRKRLGL